MSDVNDWNAQVITEFRANAGKVASFGDAPLLILHTKGARSGAERLNPVMYLDLDGRRYVFASKAGAATNPDWYHNLLADPSVTVELGTRSYPARATPLDEGERARVYAEQATRYPQFAEYQEKTDRAIPVVELTPAG